MTPEEAGIYSADSHMRHLVNWMIDNDVYTFKLKELPEQFCRKWHTKAAYACHLESVSRNGTNSRTWKVAGIYDNARQAKTKMAVSDSLHNGLTLDAVKDIISNGITSPLDMAKHLNMSQSATYRALKKYFKAGKLERTTVNNYLNYSIKEA